MKTKMLTWYLPIVVSVMYLALWSALGKRLQKKSLWQLGKQGKEKRKLRLNL